MKIILITALALLISLCANAQDTSKAKYPWSSQNENHDSGFRITTSNDSISIDWVLKMVDSAQYYFSQGDRLSGEADLWDSMANDCKASIEITPDAHIKAMLKQATLVYKNIELKLFAGATSCYKKSIEISDQINSMFCPTLGTIRTPGTLVTPGTLLKPKEESFKQ